MLNLNYLGVNEITLLCVDLPIVKTCARGVYIGQEENWNHIKYHNVEKVAAILTLCDISISDNISSIRYFISLTHFYLLKLFNYTLLWAKFHLYGIKSPIDLI